MALLSCPNCGGKISEKAWACPHCKLSMNEIINCPECGETCLSENEYCPSCGYPFDDIVSDDDNYSNNDDSDYNSGYSNDDDDYNYSSDDDDSDIHDFETNITPHLPTREPGKTGLFKNFFQKNQKQKQVSYYFYRPLTERWNKRPSVVLYGLDGSQCIVSFSRGRLSVENDTHVCETDAIDKKTKDPGDLFSGFNNFLGDAYRSGIIKGPVSGGPVYLELLQRWTITNDICREFLEDVWYALKGEMESFK
ncbi:MAG: zinc ribbon domain-containing protein [Lachnospiraceae bacterium]|nr:zinc ribbon domain-containing protein [Lachnospiraceae bacterium]